MFSNAMQTQTNRQPSLEDEVDSKRVELEKEFEKYMRKKQAVEPSKGKVD